MKITELEDRARGTNVRRSGVGEERLPERVLLAAYRTWHEQDGTGTAADPVVCDVYGEVDVSDLGVMAETQDTAKTDESILLTGDFFAREVIAGKTPPDWLMVALSEQLNRLRVDILYAWPDRAPYRLTRRTTADLKPKVKELAKSAREIRKFVMGSTTSKKKKSAQTEKLLDLLKPLRALVGNPVLYSYLFAGAPLGVPVCLPCDDSQFVLCLEMIERHLRVTVAGDLGATLASCNGEFVACLDLIESLADKCLVGNATSGQDGRPQKIRLGVAKTKDKRRQQSRYWSPQLRCVLIITIAQKAWPEFVSPADYLCEMFWREATGKPHTMNTKNGCQGYEVWRRDWLPAAPHAPKEIRRDVEHSFLSARRG